MCGRDDDDGSILNVLWADSGVGEIGLLTCNYAERLFYESALIDHENAFRNITKTHFET